MPTYDTIILGVGTMGAAAALALSKRGQSVLAIEQFDIPHAKGAHHGHSRIFRHLRYQQPEYLQLIRRSEQLWDELDRNPPAPSGRVGKAQQAQGGSASDSSLTSQPSRPPILSRPGLLCLGKAHSQPMTDTLAWAHQHHIPIHTFTRAELSARYPLFNVPADYIGILEPHAGYLRPELAVQTMAAESVRRGVTLHDNERTLSWSASSRGADFQSASSPPITVTTDRATYHANHLIITAGAWTSRVVADLGLPLTVTREVLLWTQPPDPTPFHNLPCWFIDDPSADCRDGLIYGFPILSDRPGFKFSLHGRGTPTNPDTVNRTVSPQEQAELLEPIRRFIPAAVGPIIETAVCTYTNSPDLHPIIDRHPHHPNVAFACGFSGHGFKYAPAIGELLADLTTDTPHPRPFFSLNRLA